MKLLNFAILLISALLLSCNNGIARFRTDGITTPDEKSYTSCKRLSRIYKQKLQHRKNNDDSDGLSLLDKIWLSADVRLAKDDDMQYADAHQYADSVLFALACTHEYYTNALNTQAKLRHELTDYHYNYGHNQLENNSYVIRSNEDGYSQNKYDFKKISKEYQSVSLPGVSVSLILNHDSLAELKDDAYSSFTVRIKTTSGIFEKTFQKYDFAYPLKIREFPVCKMVHLPFFIDNMAAPMYGIYLVDNSVFFSACLPDFATDDHFVVLSTYKNAQPNFYYLFPELCVYDRLNTRRFNISLVNIVSAITSREYAPIFKQAVVNRISGKYLPEYQSDFSGEICLEFNAKQYGNELNNIDTTFYYKILF